LGDLPDLGNDGREGVMRNRWASTVLLGYLEEARTKGVLVLICESPQEAKRLRWALYYHKHGYHDISISLKGRLVTVARGQMPKVEKK
jgi:hypothetical protein